MASSDNPISEALKLFIDAIPKNMPLLETIPILNARGRVLGENVQAEIDDPPFSRSIMEGFVLAASDLNSASESNAVLLDVMGEIAVGQSSAVGLAPGKALQVTTGSFIPPGDYTVVRAWDVKRDGDKISVSKPSKPGDNIERQAEMRKKGEILLKKGHRISSDDIFLLASQGILGVSVARAPRIALFSSGNEVIPPTEPFKVGAIWDCNRYGLSSLIEEAGGHPLFQGIMEDDFENFTEKLKTGLQAADMAVISGGTAIGGEDFTANLINQLGPPGTLVNGIPMRSGKPIVLGLAEGKPIVCVAGHPPEAARGFKLFAQPAISHLMGEDIDSEE